jgi:hypothetical protein
VLTSRLLIPFLLLTTLFFGLSLTMILIGHQQPPSAWAQILHLNECELPCWIGIVPGQTTLAEARQELERVYGDTTEYELKIHSSFIVRRRFTGESFRIAFSSQGIVLSENSVITEISLLPYDDLDSVENLPKISDLHDVVGDVERVRQLEEAYEVGIAILQKDSRFLIVVGDTECNKLFVDQIIWRIDLRENIYNDFRNWISRYKPWHGFGRCYHLK